MGTCKRIKRCLCEKGRWKRCKGICRKRKKGEGADDANAVEDKEEEEKKPQREESRKSRMSERRGSLEALQKLGVVKGSVSEAEQEVRIQELKRKALEAEVAKSKRRRKELGRTSQKEKVTKRRWSILE